MHQDTEVLILNFPLGEDSVCWCYLNHSPNLVIDECRVNRSIKLLQSTTEREPYTESQRQPEEALFFSLPSRQHMNLQVHVRDMYTHENLTRILYKAFPYYVCIDIHVSFLSDSADKTKRVTSTNSARRPWIFMRCPFAKETHCIRVWTVMRDAHLSQLLLRERCLLAPGLLRRGDESAPEKRFKLQSHQQQLSEMNLIKVNDSSAFWDESGLPWRETFPCDRHAMKWWFVLHPDPMLTSDVPMPCECKWW